MSTRTRFRRWLILSVSFFVCTGGSPVYSADYRLYSILHTFAGGGDGVNPWFGAPVVSGAAIYGMTAGGGFRGSGIIFKIGTDGSGYRILHTFDNSPPNGDGTTPRGALALSGNTLYGFTAYGGPPYISVGGSIFKINTDGSGYKILRGYGEGTGHQAHPYGTPVISGAKLYGMTNSVDTGLNGSIFSMNTDGTGYSLLHEFEGKPSDGAFPTGSLTLVGSKLYGMTPEGGSAGISGGGSGNGVIFSMNLDGSDYQVLHNFQGHPNDGNNPSGSLTLAGDRLYGMTASGGLDNGSGVLFRINTDGTGYKVLLDFSSVAVTGPKGSLTLRGSQLWGMTSGGGPGGSSGVIFRVKTDGTGFEIMHGFRSSEGDGGDSLGDLTLSGSTFYGWTYAGGINSGGVVFSYKYLPNQDSSGAATRLLLLSD